MSGKKSWDERFAVEHYLFGTAPNAFLARNAKAFTPGMRVLSLADGEGRNAVFIAEQGAQVISQDLSPVAQNKARRLAQERDVSLDFLLADITKLDWTPDSYDAIVGIFFQFLSPDERSGVFDGIKRALKPGGLVLVEGYGPKQLDYGTGGPRILENLYTVELLEAAFEDFADVDVTAYDAEIQEGPGHSGRSALVDLVARKPL